MVKVRPREARAHYILEWREYIQGTFISCVVSLLCGLYFVWLVFCVVEIILFQCPAPVKLDGARVRAGLAKREDAGLTKGECGQGSVKYIIPARRLLV